MKVTQTRKGSPSPMKPTQPTQPPPAPAEAPTPAAAQHASELARRSASVAEAMRALTVATAHHRDLLKSVDASSRVVAQATEDLARAEASLISLARA